MNKYILSSSRQTLDIKSRSEIVTASILVATRFMQSCLYYLNVALEVCKRRKTHCNASSVGSGTIMDTWLSNNQELGTRDCFSGFEIQKYSPLKYSDRRVSLAFYSFLVMTLKLHRLLFSLP